MNRTLLSVAAIGLVVTSIASCSDKSATAPETTPTTTASGLSLLPVASVLVSPATATLKVGATLQLSGTLRDANNSILTGRVITLSSSNTAVSTVSASGLVTAVGAGTATITVLSETKTGTSTITVTASGQVLVASVLVSPATATLKVGATLQLSGSLRDANNNILTGRVITLSSSNTAVSTVSATGLVTAVAAGNATITVLSETKTGTSVITVGAAGPVPVASVTVSPAAASLQVGATIQLSGTLRDANNNILTGRVITVSSSNTAVSTVSASGLVTAVGAGSATITAVSETKSGTSAITVTTTAPPPPPPPPPPPGGGPVWRGNEPSGMTSIKERPFNSLTEDASWSTLASPGATIGSDASAPHSASGTLQMNYPAGFSGGSSPANTETYAGTYRVLYFCYWIKHSSNWQGHNTGISKHGYVWMGNNPLFVYEADGAGSNPLHARMALQGVVAQPNSDGWYTQNLVPSATFTRGQWDYVEILLTGNTAGTVNGAMDVYLNGVHVTHWANIQYSTGTTQWNEFRIYPVWGGVGDVVTANQSLAWDHVYISGRN